MKVNLIDITTNPIEKIYKSYRICYSKDIFENVKIKSQEEMIDFILPLVELGHTSPLEHVSFTFSIEGISRACLAQLTRHRMFKFNVQSQRYVDAKHFGCEMPSSIALNEEASYVFMDFINGVMEAYKDLQNLGIPKEDARSILPQATTCNLVVTCDLHNFRNFLRQRLCKEAQEEIRELADRMNSQVKKYIPFVDHKVLLCGKCGKCFK